MISSYFIERPIFACVISILITLIGATALFMLPVEQYPSITPPQIQVTASFPGADAATVAESLATPLEQQINGVEKMIYMNSQNSATGTMNLTVFFDIGTDVNMAQVNVQNRVNLALPQLPAETQKIGVSVKKRSTSILMVAALQSKTGLYDDIFLSNYATINIVDELLRVPGVSEATVINARDYSMKIWLKPDRMAQLGFTVGDIEAAVMEQNRNFGAGQIGKAPTSSPVELTVPILVQGRLSEPQEFEEIILRADLDGSVVKLKDVARVELAAENYDVIGKLNAQDAIIIAIYQQFDANALAVADGVKKKIEDLSARFPADLICTVPFDTTKYIKSSIEEVAMTILEAAVLVSLVVLIFLQKFRATLVPVLAMLVSIIGAFAGLYILGFSINTLTLFGLVLAIGTVVDDAIVVIENVDRNVRELGLEASAAAHRAMEEVSGPVIATTCVLCAVFIPVAFLGGISGQLYRQFAVTIAISVIISSIVALTLAPALAVFFLKKQENSGAFARNFNHYFSLLTSLYIVQVKRLCLTPILGISAFGFIIAWLTWLAWTIPTSFVPEEDQGYLIAVANLPDAASLERTERVDDDVYHLAEPQKGVENVVTFTGFNLLDGDNRTSRGTNFITLTDWGLRKSRDLHAQQILQALAPKYRALTEAQVFLFNPPSIRGLGTVGGFEFWIENRGEGGIDKVESAIQEFLAAAAKRPEIQQLTTTLETDNLQLKANLDRYKTRSLGVPIADAFQSLQVFMGSLYINDFNKYGRTFRVTAEAEPKFRESIKNLDEIYVRSESGTMIPLSVLVSIEYSRGANLVSHFNGFLAGKILGNTAPGYSSGEAMAAMEEVAHEVLPEGMSFSWSGQAYQEKFTGGAGAIMLLGGMLVVYLTLCALYERWILPISIILTVPLGLFGAFFAIWLRGLSNDVYFQVGLVTLVGLAAKNAILIVEFAIQKFQAGYSLLDSALEASKLRFRAILMTSFTFILGVIPLVISSGAGAASRQAVGTSVFGGMIAATLLAVFMVPLIFKLIVQWSEGDHETSQNHSDA